jgi:TRAP-type uncharacterized transport system substrate-binding protein
MKLFTLAILAGAMTLAGCASTNDSTRRAGGPAEETYVPLGTLIAKKTSARNDNQAVNMQSFENARTMESGTNNSGQVR